MPNSTGKWRLPLMAGAALVAGMVASGGSFALWSAADTADGAVITAGNLDVSSDSNAPLWRVSSAPGESPGEEIMSSEFLVRAGDATTADFDFTLTMEGDNMRAALNLDWRTAPELPEGVTGTYVLLDAEREPVLDEEGNSVRGALPSNTENIDLGVFDVAGETAIESLTLQMALDFSEMADRFGPDSEPQTADLGEFAVVLDQDREEITE